MVSAVPTVGTEQNKSWKCWGDVQYSEDSIRCQILLISGWTHPVRWWSILTPKRFLIFVKYWGLHKGPVWRRVGSFISSNLLFKKCHGCWSSLGLHLLDVKWTQRVLTSGTPSAFTYHLTHLPETPHSQAVNFLSHLCSFSLHLF